MLIGRVGSDPLDKRATYKIPPVNSRLESVAQLVEHRVKSPEVAGSNPAGPLYTQIAGSRPHRTSRADAHEAQVANRLRTMIPPLFSTAEMRLSGHDKLSRVFTHKPTRRNLGRAKAQ